MFRAIKEHLAAGADAHLENSTAKRFWLSARQPPPPHPSAPFSSACSPHLPITPPSCFQLWLLFSTYLTAAASPGGRRGHVCSQMPHAKGRLHPALPEGPPPRWSLAAFSSMQMCFALHPELRHAIKLAAIAGARPMK